jgi:glucan phosphorylase
MGELYADQPAWTRKVILNIAASGAILHAPVKEPK